MMNLTLHQLHVFGTVARLKSMTEAARRLHLTQPAVSIQIKQLQESIDIPLIEIVGRKLYLTEAGEHLYELYKNVNYEMESFNAVISQLKGGLKGKLTITSASTAKYFLPYLLGEFQRRYPGVTVSLKVTNRNEVLHHLSQNKYDLAILTQVPNMKNIAAVPFLENPLVMGAPPEHPLAGEKNISAEKIKNEQFIFREVGSGTRMMMTDYLEKNGIEVNPVMELGTNEAVKQAVMAGIGLSIISKLSIGNELYLNKISILDMRNFPISTNWHVIYKTEKKISPVTQNFVTFLREKNITQYLP